MSEGSYRQAFSTASSADNYDEVVYAPGSNAEVLWRVEAPIVRRLAETALRSRTHTRHLDFACGTGRVLSLLEDLAEETVGIDISAPMLARAGARCRRARLVCTDVTRSDADVEGLFDLITSFRFLTNAEPGLRSAALKVLHEHLKDDGVLIVNAHSNPFGYRAVLLPYHWFRDYLHGRPLFGYLSNRHARRLLHEAGFEVRQTIGMGIVPGKLHRFVPRGWGEVIESRFAGTPGIQAIGNNQVFVCTKRR